MKDIYVTPKHVLDYILDPTIPASNFLVDGYEAIIGHPEYRRLSHEPAY